MPRLSVVVVAICSLGSASPLPFASRNRATGTLASPGSPASTTPLLLMSFQIRLLSVYNTVPIVVGLQGTVVSAQLGTSPSTVAWLLIIVPGAIWPFTVTLNCTTTAAPGAMLGAVMP